MLRGIQLWACPLHLRKSSRHGATIALSSRAIQGFRLESQALLKPQFHPSVCGASQCGKTENLRVMFVRQIVDPAEDRQMWVHFIFRRNVDEPIIFDVEIRSAEIQFFARVYKLCFRCGAESFAPKI